MNRMNWFLLLILVVVLLVIVIGCMIALSPATPFNSLTGLKFFPLISKSKLLQVCSLPYNAWYPLKGHACFQLQVCLSMHELSVDTRRFPTICLSVFGHFWVLARKGLIS